MSFTHALHYPWIDIRDLGWLKSAALYWDRISTIVPGSIENPYHSIEARTFQDEGVLLPLRVEPDMPEVDQASQDFAIYSQRPEATTVLLPPGVVVARERWRVSQSREHALLHPEKISDELRYRLLTTGQAQEIDGWLEVNRDAANCYMTILAGNLAQNRGLALLADEERFEPLANLALRGEAIQPGIPDARRMGEAVLANLVMQTVNVTPDTPVEKIIRFRRDHSDDLAHFRQTIGRLASQLEEEVPSLEVFQQQTRDIYLNDLKPAMNDLKACLRDAGIGSFVSYLEALIFAEPVSLIPGTMLVPMFGPLAVPVALLAGAGLSITAKVVTFRLDRKKLLRENPYSYVLAAQSVFGERRPREGF